MSAASVTAYLSPTMARNFASNSGESGGAAGWTIFIFVTCSCLLRSLFPPHRGAAQPVVDGFAQSVMRQRHYGDGARAAHVERAKITEKMGGGLIDIAPSGQIHHRGRSLHARHRSGAERQQRLAGLDPVGSEPHTSAP